MIKRYDYNKDPCVDDYVEKNDGSVVYYTDHLRAMSALEEENKRLRSALADVALRVCSYMPAYENKKESGKGEKHVET